MKAMVMMMMMMAAGCAAYARRSVMRIAGGPIVSPLPQKISRLGDFYITDISREWGPSA
jgi:hypothetical protein